MVSGLAFFRGGTTARRQSAASPRHAIADTSSSRGSRPSNRGTTICYQKPMARQVIRRPRKWIGRFQAARYSCARIHGLRLRHVADPNGPPEHVGYRGLNPRPAADRGPGGHPSRTRRRPVGSLFQPAAETGKGARLCRPRPSGPYKPSPGRGPRRARDLQVGHRPSPGQAVCLPGGPERLFSWAWRFGQGPFLPCRRVAFGPCSSPALFEVDPGVWSRHFRVS